MIMQSLTKEERVALIEEVSELIENVYICLSYSEELTFPVIKSGEFVQRGDYSNYIWKKLIEVKKCVENLEKFGFKNIPKYIRTKHQIIYSRQLNKSIEDDIRKFRIISQSLTWYSKIWSSSLITYLLSSDVLERMIVLREKISEPDKIQPKTWHSIIINGGFKYYMGYNRIKLLAHHETLIESEDKKKWWEIRYLDYNIKDVVQLSNSVAFDYFTIDPTTEMLSFFFTTVAKITSILCKGSLVILEIIDFYRSKHKIYMENEAFIKSFGLNPNECELKDDSNYFVFLCKADITRVILAYDAREINISEFKSRGFDALVRFRKVVKRHRKDIQSDSPFLGYTNDRIYYIPIWFHDNKEEFVHFLTSPEAKLDQVKLIPIFYKLRFYFSIFPEYLKYYREESKFSYIHELLFDLPKVAEKPDLPKARYVKPSVTFYYYVPVRIYGGYTFKTAEFLNQVSKEVEKHKVFRIHLIMDSHEPITTADEIVHMLNNFKFPKEGQFKWENNYSVGTIRRCIYKYIYKQSPPPYFKNDTQ